MGTRLSPRRDGRHEPHGDGPDERNHHARYSRGSAVLIAFLINAADISTNDVFASTNVMLIGLALLALHVAGVGSGLRTGSSHRR